MPAVLSKPENTQDKPHFALAEAKRLAENGIYKTELMMERAYDDQDNFPEQVNYLMFCENLQWFNSHFKEHLERADMMINVSQLLPDCKGRQNEISYKYGNTCQREVLHLDSILNDPHLVYVSYKKIENQPDDTQTLIYNNVLYDVDLDFKCYYRSGYEIIDADLSEKIIKTGIVVKHFWRPDENSWSKGYCVDENNKWYLVEYDGKVKSLGKNKPPNYTE